MAAGIISPTNKTNVTEITMACHDSVTKPSRKMGNASAANAFHNNNDTNNK